MCTLQDGWCVLKPDFHEWMNEALIRKQLCCRNSPRKFPKKEEYAAIY